MNKVDFVSFCYDEFKRHGFIKKGKYFYRRSEQLLCGIYLQKSNYGEIYYVNYFYCLGLYDNSTVFPTQYESDIDGRILAMSKTQTYQGKRFLTAMIEYTEYVEDELRPFFDKAFAERVLPPLMQGKKYILDNLERLYFLTLNQDEVMRKLQF